MNNNFLEVTDIMDILKVQKSKAYKIIRQLNDELEEKGYFVLQGKVPKKYFEQRIYL